MESKSKIILCWTLKYFWYLILQKNSTMQRFDSKGELQLKLLKLKKKFWGIILLSIIHNMDNW